MVFSTDAPAGATTNRSAVTKAPAGTAAAAMQKGTEAGPASPAPAGTAAEATVQKGTEAGLAASPAPAGPAAEVTVQKGTEAGPAASPESYAKFTMSGIPGTKHVIFISEDTKVDQAFIQKVWKVLKITPPGLMLKGGGSGKHPTELLTDEEMRKPAIRDFAEAHGIGQEPNQLRKIIVQKVKGIVQAVLAAIEQTGSCTFHEHFEHMAVDIYYLSAFRNCRQALAISVSDLHEPQICHKNSKQMLQTLYQRSVSFNDEAKVDAFGPPIPLDGDWLANSATLEKPFKGHSWMVSTDPESGENKMKNDSDRHPTSQWAFLQADIYLMRSKPIRENGLDLDNYKEARFGLSSILPVVPDPSVIAPTGCVLVGWENEHDDQIRHLMYIFEEAMPTVIVNHSGSFCSFVAEMLLALISIMKGNDGLMKTLSSKKTAGRQGADADVSVKAQSSKRTTTTQELQGRNADTAAMQVDHAGLMKTQRNKQNSRWRGVKGDLSEPSDVNAKRLKNVSAKALLDHAMEAAGLNKGLGPWTVADVTWLIDLCKQRPRVFLETIKVVDPLNDSPEAALEALSSCFSSTYTGALELGASRAQTEVVMEAWRLHKTLEEKATTLQCRATMLMTFSSVFALGAVLCSVLLDKLARCLHESHESADSRSLSDLDNGIMNANRGCVDSAANFEDLKQCLWSPSPVNSHASRRLYADRSGKLCMLANSLPEKFSLEAVVQVLQILIIVVPVLSGLLVTLASRFQYNEKWAKIKVTCGELVRQIYLFRGGAGPYSFAIRGNEDMKGSEKPDELSPAARTKAVRMLFVSRVNALVHGVMMSSLLDEGFDTSSNSTKPMDEETIKDYALNALYTETRSTGYLASCCWGCCCQKRRQRQSFSPKPTGYQELLAAEGSEEDETASYILVSNGDITNDHDDFLSPLTAEIYFKSRLKKLKARYRQDAPKLALQQNSGDLLIFLCGVVASLLGAFHASGWIPVILGLSSMTAGFLSYKGCKPHLSSMNGALADLMTLEVQYSALSNMDRRVPNFKQMLISKTEQCAVTIMQSWAGTAAVASNGVAESGQNEEQEEAASKKSKQQ